MRRFHDDKLEYLAAGKCSQGCGRTLSSKWYCEPCLNSLNTRVRTKQQQYLSQGKCRSGCGRDLVTKNHCRPCADSDSKQTMARVRVRKERAANAR